MGKEMIDKFHLLGKYHVLPLSKITFPLYEEMFALLAHLYRQAGHLLSQPILQTLLTLIVQGTCELCPEQAAIKEVPGSRHFQQYRRFIRLVHAFYPQQHQVAFYAGEMNVKSAALCRLVKKESGRTAMEIINSTLIMDAKTQLRTCEAPVKDIALNLGFNNAAFFNKFFKAISGCILPMIAPMAAGGIIKGVLTILTTFGVLTSDNGIYLILYAAADALMYFMPIIVGSSAGKVFGMNPYTAAVIGAAMLYPKLAAFVGAEETLTFFGLKVTMLDYSQTLLPILLAVFVASWIEKAAKKIIPQMLQLMFVPTVVLVITLPLTLLVVGPVMTGVSNALATGVNALYNAVPVVCGGVLGAFWQLFVMMGVHAAMIPIILNNLTTLGYCPVNAILGLTVWALAGVALGYALKVKDGETRATAFGTMASALCGITEPVLFGVTMKIRTNMIAAMAGGGVGSFFMGLMNTKNYSGGSPGLLTLPSYIGLDTPMANFYYACAGAAIAFVVAFIVSFVLFRDEKKN